MAKVPLGKGAYSRAYGQEPEIKLINRFFEADPTNAVEGSALLSRPGSRIIAEGADPPVQRMITQSGAFGGDLFVISGGELYRLSPTLDITFITGAISDVRRPELAITTGPSYEHLFVSDGENLQIYEGESFSRGTLSEDGTDGITAGDQVRIGDTYYEWTTGSVDSGSPDGSSTDPWLVAIGSASRASAVLRFVSDGRIDIAGYAVFIGNIPEGTPPGEDDDIRFVYVVSDVAELERNNPDGTGTNPYRLATPEGITARSYLFLLKDAINATGNPGVDYSTALVDPHNLVKAGEVTGPSQPADPTENSLTIRAINAGTDGNDIQVRNVLDRAPIWRWEDQDGNPTQSLTGGSDTAGDIETAMEALARAIDASGIPGTDYSTGLTAHPDVEVESQEGGTIEVIARTRGNNNSITTTTTSTGLAWGAATLEGGGEHRLDPVEMPDDQPAGSVEAVAGWVAVSVQGGDRVYGIRPGQQEIRALDFLTAESEPDRINNLMSLSDQLVLLGASTIEFWSATGNPQLPFRPSRGQTMNVGALQDTGVKTGGRILFVGSDGVAYATNGGQEQRISNHGIEEAIRSQLSSDLAAEGIETWFFEQDGHEFFVMHLGEGLVPPDPELLNTDAPAVYVFNVDDTRVDRLRQDDLSVTDSYFFDFSIDTMSVGYDGSLLGVVVEGSVEGVVRKALNGENFYPPVSDDQLPSGGDDFNMARSVMGPDGTVYMAARTDAFDPDDHPWIVCRVDSSGIVQDSNSSIPTTIFQMCHDGGSSLWAVLVNGDVLEINDVDMSVIDSYSLTDSTAVNRFSLSVKEGLGGIAIAWDSDAPFFTYSRWDENRQTLFTNSGDYRTGSGGFTVGVHVDYGGFSYVWWPDSMDSSVSHVQKLDSGGGVVWTYDVESSAGEDVALRGVTADLAGNVYVFPHESADPDVAPTKLDASGTLIATSSDNGNTGYPAIIPSRPPPEGVSPTDISLEDISLSASFVTPTVSLYSWGALYYYTDGTGTFVHGKWLGQLQALPGEDYEARLLLVNGSSSIFWIGGFEHDVWYALSQDISWVYNTSGSRGFRLQIRDVVTQTIQAESDVTLDIS